VSALILDWFTPLGLAALGYCAAVMLSLAFVPLELPAPWRGFYTLLCGPALAIGALACVDVAIWACVHTLPWLVFALPVIALIAWLYDRRFGEASQE
jgi:hypothetical protein